MWLRVRGAMTIVRAVDGRQAQLVETHLAIARRAAGMIYPRVRGAVAFEDVVALANAGLAEAAARFDPGRGASFATFAWYRIHGAILDGLRASSELPRRAWARLVALREAGETLSHVVDAERRARPARGAPRGSEVLAAITDAAAAVPTRFTESLDTLRDRGFDAPGDAPAPPDGLDQARTAARLHSAVGRLPDKQRAIVTKHYFEGKSLLEAGAELGLSKSWASRLHAQAVGELRAQLAE
jgi:RNA polymerase sigma factor FliA